MSKNNVVVSSDYGPIILNINDYGVGRNIISGGYHSRDDIELTSQLLKYILQKKNALLYYDVGANIGTHSLALSKIFGSTITIRAFEAQRQVYYMLCGNMAINCVDNVHCHHAAVADQCGIELEIPVPDYSMPNNFGGLELLPAHRTDNQNMIKSGREKVSTVSLDYFDEPVDFIKFDIEGMENIALNGAEKTISAHRPICFVEILKVDAAELLKRFSALNYWAYQKNADLIFIPAEYMLSIDGLKRVL